MTTTSACSTFSVPYETALDIVNADDTENSAAVGGLAGFGHRQYLLSERVRSYAALRQDIQAAERQP